MTTYLPLRSWPSYGHPRTADGSWPAEYGDPQLAENALEIYLAHGARTDTREFLTAEATWLDDLFAHLPTAPTHAPGSTPGTPPVTSLATPLADAAGDDEALRSIHATQDVRRARVALRRWVLDRGPRDRAAADDRERRRLTEAVAQFGRTVGVRALPCLGDGCCTPQTGCGPGCGTGLGHRDCECPCAYDCSGGRCQDERCPGCERCSRLDGGARFTTAAHTMYASLAAALEQFNHDTLSTHVVGADTAIYLHDLPTQLTPHVPAPREPGPVTEFVGRYLRSRPRVGALETHLARARRTDVRKGRGLAQAGHVCGLSVELLPDGERAARRRARAVITSGYDDASTHHEVALYWAGVKMPLDPRRVQAHCTCGYTQSAQRYRCVHTIATAYVLASRDER